MIVSTIICTALGGALGALIRWMVTSVSDRYLGKFAWGILAVNLAGCIIAGAILALPGFSESPSTPLNVFLVTGLLGGLTTWSSLATSSISGMEGKEEGGFRRGLLLFLCNIAICPMGFVLGLMLTERLV